MSANIADEEQHIREAHHDYLYHDSPCVEEGRFAQLRYWLWGIQYFGGIRAVFNQLDGWSSDLLADVNCGESRFLYADRKTNCRRIAAICHR